MSDTDLPDVSGGEPAPTSSDGLEERGQGAGRLLGTGAEQAIAGDDPEDTAEADAGAATSAERQAEEHPDTD